MNLKLPENKFGCFVFWPLAVYIFIGGVQNLSQMSKLDENGVITVAEVISQKENSKGTKLPTIQFDIAGDTHTFTTSKLARCKDGFMKPKVGCTRSHPDIGAKIDIRVNPDNPKEFLKLSGGSTNEKSFVFVFLMIFLIVAPWVLKIPEHD